jgi:hypothetical protein
MYHVVQTSPFLIVIFYYRIRIPIKNVILVSIGHNHILQVQFFCLFDLIDLLIKEIIGIHYIYDGDRLLFRVFKRMQRYVTKDHTLNNMRLI